MGDLLKNSSYGNQGYGPFPDNTVQTYFRFSPPHTSRYNPQLHVDLNLMKPAVPRDISIQKLSHIDIKCGS